MSAYESRLNVLHVGMSRSFEPLSHAVRFEQDAWDSRCEALELLNKAKEEMVFTESLAAQALEEYKEYYNKHKPTMLRLRDANPSTLKDAYYNKRKMNNINIFLNRCRRKHMQLKKEAEQAKKMYEWRESDYKNALDLHTMALATLKSLASEYNKAVVAFSKLAVHSRL